MSNGATALAASRATTLVLDLSDAALIARLSAMPIGQRLASAEAALRVGYAVLDATALTVVPSAPGSALATTVDASVKGALAPLSSQLGAVQASLGTLLRTNDKSQQKGVVGEQLVVEQLRRAFPLDAFELTAASAHGADIVARVLCAGAGGAQEARREVRIEVKSYARAVPTAELDKFKRDLRATGATLGLFVSLSSGIAGVRGRMAVDRCDGATLVLVPDAGLDGTGCLWGLLILKAIAAQLSVPAGGTLNVEAALDAVSAAGDDLVALGREAAALEDALAGAARALDAGRSQALAMRRRALAAERFLQAAVMRAILAPCSAPSTSVPVIETMEELGAVSSTTTTTTSAAPIGDVSDALRPYVEELDAVARSTLCTTRRQGAETLVERNGVVVARAGGKRKLNVAFETEPGELIAAERNVEDVRGTTVVVNGDAPIARWAAAVKRRLACNMLPMSTTVPQ